MGIALLARGALCFDGLGTGHRRSNRIPLFAGCHVPLRAGEVEPHVRGNIVLGYSITRDVHEAEAELSASSRGAAQLSMPTCWPMEYMRPTRCLESADPCSASRCNHASAVASLRGTPRPCAYIPATLSWASAWPCSAARRNHVTASASSRATPNQLAYISPSRYCVPTSPCSAARRVSRSCSSESSWCADTSCAVVAAATTKQIGNSVLVRRFIVAKYIAAHGIDDGARLFFAEAAACRGRPWQHESRSRR